MDRAYYDEYYELERNHWWFRVRERILRRVLGQLLSGKTASILNIGAATGRTSEMLSDFGQVTSVDTDTESCNYVRKNKHLKVVEASVLKLPFKSNIFDVVCAFDVLEHVDDDKKAVAEMVRVLRSRGYIALTAPAFSFLWNKHDEVNRHYRRYVLDEICRLFVRFKGHIIKRTYFNSILFLPIAFFRFLSKPLPWLLRSGSGSDFSVLGKNKNMSCILEKIFGLEEEILSRWTLGIGVSLLLIWQKDNKYE